MTLNRFACHSFIALALATSAAIAQTGGGATLVGNVKDATGAAVAGAKVTVINTATSFTTETTTSGLNGFGFWKRSGK